MTLQRRFHNETCPLVFFSAFPASGPSAESARETFLLLVAASSRPSASCRGVHSAWRLARSSPACRTVLDRISSTLRGVPAGYALGTGRDVVLFALVSRSQLVRERELR